MWAIAKGTPVTHLLATRTSSHHHVLLRPTTTATSSSSLCTHHCLSRCSLLSLQPPDHLLSLQLLLVALCTNMMVWRGVRRGRETWDKLDGTTDSLLNNPRASHQTTTHVLMNVVCAL